MLSDLILTCRLPLMGVIDEPEGYYCVAYLGKFHARHKHCFDEIESAWALVQRMKRLKVTMAYVLRSKHWSMLEHRPSCVVVNIDGVSHGSLKSS